MSAAENKQLLQQIFSVRERSLREGLVIFPVSRATNGEWRVQADFQTK